MTRVDVSPEQRDAEAQPTEDRDLDQAIALHRALYAADLGWLLKLHQRDGESGLGPPFSAPFEAFLDGRYGQFPWSKAMMSLRQTCRTMHRPKHTDRDEWHGSLCHSLTSLVIRCDYSLDMARLQLGLPDAGKTRRTLDNALLTIERKLDDMQDADEREQKAQVARSPGEWMSEVHRQRHDQPGLHRSECEQCRRAAA